MRNRLRDNHRRRRAVAAQHDGQPVHVFHRAALSPRAAHANESLGRSDPPAATTAAARRDGRTIDSRRMWRTRTLGWARNEGGCQTDPSPIFISMMPSVRHQAPSLPTFIHPFPFSRSSEPPPLLNSLKAGGRTNGRTAVGRHGMMPRGSKSKERRGWTLICRGRGFGMK